MSDIGFLSDSSCGDKDFHSKLSNSKSQADCDAGKPKRHTACELCRRRKLKCDGSKPTCGTCIRLKKTCQYTTVHKKSGPQRGYLKKLEDRLEQLEKLLANKIPEAEKNDNLTTESDQAFSSSTADNTKKRTSSSAEESYSAPTTTNHTTARVHKQPYLSSAEDALLSEFASPHSTKNSETNKKAAWAGMSMPNTTTEMFGIDEALTQYGTSLMSLNVEEPYPREEIVSQLVNEYFRNRQACFDFLQKTRFHTMLNLGKIKPYLLYSVLLTGASYSENSMFHLQDQMYKRAMKYIFKAEHSEYGQELVNLQYVQALILLAIHENRIGAFGRAWLTVGKAIKASLQTGLHNLELKTKRDCLKLNGKTDRVSLHDIDERRRTIWTVYMLDMYCAIGSGWPTGIKLSDIKTNLPLDDKLFNALVSEPSVPIEKIIESPETYIHGKQSLFALSVVSAYFMGEAFTLATKGQSTGNNSLPEKWWKRQNMLSKQMNCFIHALPRVDLNSSDEIGDKIVCLNMFFQMGILGVNRSAVLKLRDQKDPDDIREFKIRCQKAGSDMVQVLRMCRNLYKTVASNPCVVFCLYTTARSFITMLEEESTFCDVEGRCFFEEVNGYGLLMQIRSQLDFIITVMKVLRSRMAMVQCFYETLQTDIHRANLSTSSEQMNIYDEFISNIQRRSEGMGPAPATVSMEKDSRTSPGVEPVILGDCIFGANGSGTACSESTKSTSITPDSQLETPPNLRTSLSDSPVSFVENLSIRGQTDLSESFEAEGRTKKRRTVKTSVGEVTINGSGYTRSVLTNRHPQFNNNSVSLEVKGFSDEVRETVQTPINLGQANVNSASFSPVSTLNLVHSNHLSMPEPFYASGAPPPPVGMDLAEDKSLMGIANHSGITPQNDNMAVYHDEFTNGVSISSNGGGGGRDRRGVETVNTPSATATNNTTTSTSSTSFSTTMYTADAGSMFGMPDLLQWNSALSLDDIIQRIN